MTSIGERIRQRRADLNWTQDKLATETGISKSFLSDVETDKRNVSAENLLKLSKSLGVSLDFLMSGVGEPQPIQNEVQIPNSLSEFAKEKNLTYTQTITLLDMSRQVIAHRRHLRPDDPDQLDWTKFYEAVKHFLK